MRTRRSGGPEAPAPNGTAENAEPARRRGALRPFAHRDFSFLLAGTMGSQLGDWIQQVGQGLLVYQLTGSAAQLGVFGFVRGAAVLLITPFGGAIADRFDRRNVLAVATLAGFLNALAVALLVATGRIAIWQLYLTSLIDGVVQSTGMPARQVMVYDAVGPEDLNNAVALNSIGNNIVRIAGPSLGGVLFGISAGACFFAQAAAYAVAVAATLLIRTRGRGHVATVSVFRSIGQGVRYAFGDSVVVAILLVTVVPALLVYPYLSFMPVFAYNVFHAGATGNGVLFTAVAVGSIVGAAFIAGRSSFRRRGLAMLLTDVAYMALIGAFALAPNYAAGYGFLVLAGLANCVYNAYSQTLLQLYVADEFRGRVLALYLWLGSFSPLGALLMGVVIERQGPRFTVAAWALTGAAIMLAVTLRSRRTRTL